MSSRTIRKCLERSLRALACACSAQLPFMLPVATPADAEPVIIRGIPSTGLRPNYGLPIWQASRTDRLSHPSIEMSAGAMQPGDTGIPDSNPTIEPASGLDPCQDHRDQSAFDPDLIPSESLWATPVDFGPGSVSRIRATFIAPVGPIPGGGFAMGVNAKTGNKDDLDHRHQDRGHDKRAAGLPRQAERSVRGDSADCHGPPGRTSRKRCFPRRTRSRSRSN